MKSISEFAQVRLGCSFVETQCACSTLLEWWPTQTLGQFGVPRKPRTQIYCEACGKKVTKNHTTVDCKVRQELQRARASGVVRLFSEVQAEYLREVQVNVTYFKTRIGVRPVYLTPEQQKAHREHGQALWGQDYVAPALSPTYEECAQSTPYATKHAAECAHFVMGKFPYKNPRLDALFELVCDPELLAAAKTLYTLTGIHARDHIVGKFLHSTVRLRDGRRE